MKIGLSPEFHRSLGLFHAAWAAMELTLDYMIGQFLKIPYEETHRLVAGIEMGRKIRILESLLQRNDHKNKSALIGALRRIQNESKRNVLVHSLIWSDHEMIVFINRSFGQQYEAKKHTFTLPEFEKHVEQFILDATKFYEAACLEDAALQAFGEAAISAISNSNTSPGPPSSSA
jgi:hypothetical protein